MAYIGQYCIYIIMTALRVFHGLKATFIAFSSYAQQFTHLKISQKYLGALELYYQLWLAINKHLPGHIAEIMQERDDSSLEGKREGKRAESERESLSRRTYLIIHMPNKMTDYVATCKSVCAYV